MADATLALTPAQIETFHAQGFLVLTDPLAPPAELAYLRECYDRMFTQRRGREEGAQFDLAGSDEEGKEASLPQILGFQRFIPDFDQTLLLANARQIVQQLLGADAHCGGGHAIYKPPFHGAATPWHQDEAYWNPAMVYRSLSIWVPLQEATVANGCMHFVPGSHRLPVLEHRPINNDPRIHGLELVDSEMHHVRDAVACPLAPGGATVHHHATLHYAGANRSPIPRRACILGGGAPAQPRPEPRRFPWNELKKPARLERAQAHAAKQQTAADSVKVSTDVKY